MIKIINISNTNRVIIFLWKLVKNLHTNNVKKKIIKNSTLFILKKNIFLGSSISKIDTLKYKLKKMITVLITSFTIILINFTFKSQNPVKTSINVIVIAFLTLLFLRVKTTNRWLRLIFLLLFLGGILIIFIILSSLSPNENSKKMKFYKIIFMLAIFTFINNPISVSTETKLRLKRFLRERFNMIIIIFLILFYFFTFINITSLSKFPIRTIMCCS